MVEPGCRPVVNWLPYPQDRQSKEGRSAVYAAPMLVLVLGPIDVVDEGGRRVVASPGVRRLLGRLAIDRGRAVSDDELIDALWASPPASARKTLHGYVHRLRRIVGPTGVVRVGSGYRLADVATDLDVVSQWRAAARAAAAKGLNEEAAELLLRASGSFRGRAVPELDHACAEAFRREVFEIELCVIEELADCRIAAGDGASVVGDLEGILARDQTRERAWYQLVQALKSVGRRTDALAAISRARRALAIELGISPGPQIAALERELLGGEAEGPIRRGLANLLPTPLMTRPGEVVLVGREREWEQLERDLDTLAAPRSVLVDILVGEAGVGKTRLAAELARVAYDKGARVLFGRASDLASAAYQPWTEALQDCPEAASLLTTLTAVLPSSQTIGTPAADRYDLFERLARVVEELATDRPLVIVFDDLHWAAQPSLQALVHLMRRSRRVRLLIVATVREPEFGGAEVLGVVGAETGATVLPIDVLDLAGVRRFLEITGSPTESIDARAESLHRRTGGNAFLLGELVRHSPQSATRETDGSSVPRSVRDVIAARARRLPPPSFELLQAAAVIGLGFDLDIVAHTRGCRPADVLDSIDAAVAAQLIVEMPTHRISYAFRHALIADAVLTTLSRARRARLHEAIATALDELRPERTLDVISHLAHHWLEGLDRLGRNTGSSYAELAGDLHVAAFAYDEACRWYERSLDALEAGADLDIRCRRELALARAATLAGNETLARQAAAAAWTSARSRDRSVEIAAALLYAGEPELNRVGGEPGHQMLQATLGTVGRAGIDGARLMARLGSALSYGARHDEAVGFALQSLSAARASGDRAAVAYAIRCRLRGWFEPAEAKDRLAMAQELTTLGVELGDPVTESWGWRWQGVTQFELGESAGIEQSLARLELLGDRLHLPNQRWGARIRLAALRTFQGRFPEARELIGEAYDRGGRLDNVIAAEVTWRVNQILEWLTGAGVSPPPGWPAPRNPTWWLTVEDIDVVPDRPEEFDLDISRMTSVFLAAVGVRSVPHQRAAAFAYPYAQRDAELVTTIAPGTMMCGSTHLYAGILAEQSVGIGPAIDHVREAVARNTQLGALPFAALAHCELAYLLGPTRNGRLAATRAREIADELDAPGLAIHPRS